VSLLPGALLALKNRMINTSTPISLQDAFPSVSTMNSHGMRARLPHRLLVMLIRAIRFGSPKCNTSLNIVGRGVNAAM